MKKKNLGLLLLLSLVFALSCSSESDVKEKVDIREFLSGEDIEYIIQCIEDEHGRL